MHSNQGYRRRSAFLAALALGYGSLVGAAGAQEDGFGHNIPLAMAVKQIVPETYKVEIAPGVDPQAKVSWSGGSWRDSLTSAAKGAGYEAKVEGDSVRIVRSGARVEIPEQAGEPEVSAGRVSPAKPAKVDQVEKVERVRRAALERAQAPAPRKVASARQPAPVIEEETVSGGGFVMVPVRQAKAAPVAAAAPVRKGAWREVSAEPAPAPVHAAWVVREGESLQAVLRDWTEREGWKLVWNSEYSYQLSSSAKFDGDFIQATTELLKSMSTVRPLVTGSFYQGNKTLVVGNDSSDGAAQ